MDLSLRIRKAWSAIVAVTPSAARGLYDIPIILLTHYLTRRHAPSAQNIGSYNKIVDKISLPHRGKRSECINSFQRFLLSFIHLTTNDKIIRTI